jgi:hypothetical protein
LAKFGHIPFLKFLALKSTSFKGTGGFISFLANYKDGLWIILKVIKYGAI